MHVRSHPLTGYLWSTCGPFSVGATIVVAAGRASQFTQRCSRLSSGMPTDRAAAWYQLLDSNVAWRLVVFRVVLLGFLDDAVRLLRRSARSTRTAASPYSTNCARYCGAIDRTKDDAGRQGTWIRKSRCGLAPSVDTAHTARMANLSSKPTFKPKPFKDGSGWYVEAEWSDGVTDHVDDFGSDSDAQDWIIHKSTGWLQKHPKSK